MSGQEGQARVVRGASLLILLQVVSRAITFVANQVLLRFMTAQLLGVSTQLEVYYLSVLFFARESLRVAIQRQGTASSSSQAEKEGEGEEGKKGRGDDDGNNQGRRRAQARETQAVVNLGYIAIGLGVVFAALLGRLYLGSVAAETLASTPHLAAAVRIYALASVLELLSEPAFVLMQARLRFGARARAESAATLAKCAVTLAVAVAAARRRLDLGVLPFALGQAAYGLALLGVYVWHGVALARGEGFSLLPRRLGQKKEDDDEKNQQYLMGLFYLPTVSLASSMMLQSFVKHLLTQGDTFLVSILSTPTAQGVYALANNYGGLAARLVFQPVEESSRSYFSRLLSTADSDDETNGSTTATTQDGDQKPQPQQGAQQQQQQQQQTAALDQASANLTALLRLYALVSLPLLALGPVAAPLALSVIAGPRWAASGAGDALAAYVYYVPLLAVNGLAEAFVASVASEAQVHAQSGWMAAFSLVFAAAGYVAMRVLDRGAVGLVWANAVNMACRILWAVCFIRRYFAGAREQRRRPRPDGSTAAAAAAAVAWHVSDALPSPLATAAAAVAGQVVRRIVVEPVAAVDGDPQRQQQLVGVREVVVELAKIAGVAVPFVCVLAFAERQFLMQCYQTVRGTRTRTN